MNPKLSILIPAFEYKLGVMRILNLIDSTLTHKIEVIIFDDSKNDDLRNEISAFNLDILYVHNSRSLGAIKNWNALLDMARGDYIFLLHHDEFPYSKAFFAKVLECLDNNRDIDLLVLNLKLLKKDYYINSFMNFSLRKFLISKIPKYVCLRNVIGPVSTLIIRKSFCPRFNNKFKWLVDVIFYLELLEKDPKILFSRDLIIISEFQRDESITSLMRQDIHYLENKERLLLTKMNHSLDFYLSSSLVAFVLRFFEKIFWLIFIVISRIFVDLKFLFLKL